MGSTEMKLTVDTPTVLSSPKQKKSEEYQQWNSQAPTSVDRCVHELIRIRALEQPTSNAVCSWDGDLTYEELDRLSNRLAYHLSGLGIGSEILVPLLFEKSKWTIVSILGVLKAGGAFVLLDPSHPIARLKSIVLQTGANVALSSVDKIEICRELVTATVVVSAATLEEFQIASELPQVNPQNAAYVMFTSGSTGEPKGVIIEHSQLCTSASNCGEAMGFHGKARVFQYASYSFDACILEIFPTLLSGGAVCIPSEWDRKNAVIDALRRMEVTGAFFTPSLLQNLDLEKVTTLETLIVGGEKVPSSLVEFWKQKLRLFLAYGPTESTVVSCILDTNKYESADGDIGRPIGCRAWIVDEKDTNMLVEKGATGELLVEGPILARGYLNDPLKTDLQFIQSPEWMAQIDTRSLPQRLYRTGDLARYNTDGSINFVGRIDAQIKVRGQRLEIGEVEKELQKCISEFKDMKVAHISVGTIIPRGSKESSVLVAFLGFGTLQLIGYLDWDRNDHVVTTMIREEQRNLTILITQIEAKLQLVLPGYALPSFYIPLRNIPYTSSGKTDSKRLRNIASALSLTQLGAYSTQASLVHDLSVAEPPLTPAGRRLQALWAEVLAIETTSIQSNDNFLVKGGDSVLAIRLVAAARAAGLNLTFDLIFRHPILSEMSLVALPLTTRDDSDSIIPPFSLLNSAIQVKDAVAEAREQCGVAEDLIEDILPASPMQSALWALSMKIPGAYMMQLVYSLPSSLDLERFEAAWSTVLSHTPMLRTRFIQDDFGLLQVVVRESFRMKVVNGKELGDLLAEEKGVRIPPGQSLSRWTLLSESNPSKHHLIWSIHHSLIDGWSASQIATAVEQAYSGISLSAKPGFNTFVRYLAQQDEAAAKDFWRSQLVDAAVSSFPELPSPTYQPIASSCLEHELNLEIKPGFTTATIIQAAWTLLLGIYSGSTDVITGVILNGRTVQLPNIEHVIGPTITTVPFRVKYSRNQSVFDLLHTIQDSYLNIIPFEQLGLQDIRRLSSDIDEACNFRNLLVIQPADDAASPKQLLLNRKHSFSSLDYALVMECEVGDKLRLRATFDDNVLHPSEIQRIFNQLECLLGQFSAANATTKVSDLQKICDADLQQLRAWTNDDKYLGAVEACVHDLVREQCDKQPNAIAICAWDGKLSYRELDELSSKLASYLTTSYGIGPQSLVALCFEKTLWNVVAMLGVLKAGGTYVPLDPKHPTDRIETIMGSLGTRSANLIVTSESHIAALSRIGDIQLLLLNSSLLDKLSTTRDGSLAKVGPSDSAVVIFTSGSTGIPKGIILEHRGLCTSFKTHGSYFGLGTHSRVLQFSAHTFDISIFDVFATLIHGGCVCIASEHDRMNNLTGIINAMDVNYICSTTTFANSLQPEDTPSLKNLMVGGEPVTREVVEKWADHVNLIHMYGPAECTIYCMGKTGLGRSDNFKNIGRGVGAHVWLTDPDDVNCLTPIGGIGEIVIAGPLVARGYIGDDLQTKSAFMENTSWASEFDLPKTPCRFYRTGDLGTYAHDGTIIILGRNDGQAKLRGQRLETEEISYQLRKGLAEPSDFAVSIVTLKDGKRILAALLVTKENINEASEAKILTSPESLSAIGLATKGVEDKLHAALPSYMVPSLFIPISKIPLTASGKTDHKVLRNLASKFSLNQLFHLKPTNGTLTRPYTKMEVQLQDLWSELLQVTDIGLHANFFRLGGDSLLSMRLVSMARKKGIALSVNLILKNPTLQGLAKESTFETSTEVLLKRFALVQHVDFSLLLNEALLQCKIEQDQVDDIYPTTPFQAGFLDPRGIGHFQAQVVFSLPQSLDLARFRAAWRSLIQSEPILRTRIIWIPSTGFFQVVTKEDGNLSNATSLDEYVENDKNNVMKLGDRLQRFCVVHDGVSEKRYFVWSGCHSTYDAWGLILLFKRLETKYLGETEESPPPFNGFIQHLSKLNREADKDFWRSHLSGVITKPLFVTPENLKKGTVTESVHIIPIPRSNSTLAGIVELAWGIVLGRHTGHNDVLLGTVRSGRDAPVPSIENILGPTACIVPTRIHFSPDSFTSDLLLALQEYKVVAALHEQLGYGDILTLTPEILAASANIVGVNIIPFSNEQEFGIRTGMKVLKKFLSFSAPFQITVTLDSQAGEMEVTMVSDEQVVSAEKREQLAREFEFVFGELLGRKNIRVRDIDFKGAEDEEWSCLRRVSHFN